MDVVADSIFSIAVALNIFQIMYPFYMARVS